MEYITVPAYSLWSPESKNIMPGRHLTQNNGGTTARSEETGFGKAGLAQIGAGFRKLAEIRYYL